MKIDGASVVVTGGTGFLGQHVVRLLKQKGAKVRSLGRKDADLCDGADEVLVGVGGKTPDAVVHLAAFCGGIGKNIASPLEMIERNARMATEVVTACVEADVPLLAVGSVCAYPRDCQVPFREDDLYSGYPEETNAPYGLAKRYLLDLMRAAKRARTGWSCQYLIPANLYGPGDNFSLRDSHVIPAIIRKVDDAQFDERLRPVKLWGTGKATRDFLYVEDAAQGVVDQLKLIDKVEFRPRNLGTGEEHMIFDVAGKIGELVCGGCRFEFTGQGSDGQPRRSVSPARAQAEIGWKVRTTLDEGLKKTVEWWKQNAQLVKAEEEAQALRPASAAPALQA